MSSPDVRVLVVDDQLVIRDGLRMMLGLLDGIEVVGTALDGADALRQVAATDPDEVVERTAPYVEAGFHELVFHGPGEDQHRFLELFSRDVLPRLRERFGN